ncbi:helix-turn-helix transcriptional regulator [Streptomyces sp. NPDC096311]|uniref:helix-turn-helix transcriptional regulator n=1 Tax=Streptomyces sp. NPDC096311 TaxID=3366083 RepID=UPI003816885E
MAQRTRPRQNIDMEVPRERIPEMTDKPFPLSSPDVKWESKTYGPRPDWLYTPGVFNPNERSVWDFLNMRAGKNREVYCSLEHIAEHIGASKSTVQRTCNSLKERGLLTWEKVKTGRNQKYPTNTYTLFVPAEFAEHLTAQYRAKVLGKPQTAQDTALGQIPEQRQSAAQKSSQHKEDPLDRACRIGTLEAFQEVFPDRPDTAQLYFDTWQEENGVTV